jgi:sugar phosphate isomerase/epimerase
MKISRRVIIRNSILTAGAASLPSALSLAVESKPAVIPVAFFEKPLELLSGEELAGQLAAIGFDGVEATVREGGRIEPERAKDELPALVETLKESDLKVLVMASSISRLDQAYAEETLRTAALLGIKRYRLSKFQYDLKKPVIPQLDALKPQLRDLAALNRELGLTAVYQNHGGESNVGGQVWDLHYLMKDFDPREIAVAYDIRHAMVEGISAWKINFHLIRDWIQAAYVKDFVFEKAKAVNVPMGTGLVGDDFYQSLKQTGFTAPVSLHVPYLQPKTKAEALAGIEQIKTDFAYLKKQLS